MMRFDRDEVDAAIQYAAADGQALHVYPALAMDAPACFKRSRTWGHLYDYNADRLKTTARKLGVRVIVVHHAGRRDQHIDLCGKPLERAIAECDVTASSSTRQLIDHYAGSAKTGRYDGD